MTSTPTNCSTKRLTVRSTVAVAALVLGVQLIAGCGAENVDSDSRPSSTTPVRVQGVGSADAIERRAHLTTVRQGLGSADAIERRLAGASACHSSADAAERFGQRTGHAPCDS